MFIKTTTGKDTNVSGHIRKMANLLLDNELNYSCHDTNYITLLSPHIINTHSCTRENNF